MKHRYNSYDNAPHNPVTYCEVCSGEAFELACDCPGVTMSQEQKNGVARGELDYINGQWVTKETAASVGK